jgi:hypothetical protein
MNFGDLQNVVLFRARQHGVNFGGAPGNQTTDVDPPYIVQLYLNQGYNEFLSRTQEAGIATLKVSFLTFNAQQSGVGGQFIPLNPIPALGGTVNPSALRVYEFTYTQAAAQERYIPIVGTARFRRWAGGYTRRLGNYAAFPQVTSQQFGKRQIDMVPGIGVNGDTINLTVCPDPQSSPANCPASNGGILANNTDVPLVPPQFHNALVEYALAEVCDANGKSAQRDVARKRFDLYVEQALEFGASYGEGDSEQSVVDVWAVYAERDISLWA